MSEAARVGLWWLVSFPLLVLMVRKDTEFSGNSTGNECSMRQNVVMAILRKPGSIDRGEGSFEVHAERLDLREFLCDLCGDGDT